MIFKIYLPVRNEEIDLENTINSIKEITNDQIVVVDNNSTDRSKEIANNLQVEVWDEKKIGKAHVIKKILKESDADVIFLTDADNTYDFKKYNDHKQLMIKSNYDMIIGKRNYEKKYLKRVERKFVAYICCDVYDMVDGLIPQLELRCQRQLRQPCPFAS